MIFCCMNNGNSLLSLILQKLWMFHSPLPPHLSAACPWYKCFKAVPDKKHHSFDIKKKTFLSEFSTKAVANNTKVACHWVKQAWKTVGKKRSRVPRPQWPVGLPYSEGHQGRTKASWQLPVKFLPWLPRVTSVTFLMIESPIIRARYSASVSLTGENLLEAGSGDLWTSA